MKVANLDKEILDLDGNSIGQIMVGVDTVIESIEVERNVSQAVESLKKLKEKEKSDTFKRVYDNACFANVEVEQDAAAFLDALELANKVRDGKDLTATERDRVRDGIPKVKGCPALVKAMAIKNLTVDPKKIKPVPEGNKDTE